MEKDIEQIKESVRQLSEEELKIFKKWFKKWFL